MRGPSDLVYGAYERQLARSLPTENLPRHVGVMLDGNRRWAKARGTDTASGHKAGADNIAPFLGWCEEAGIEVVTLWLLSTDNLTAREPAEIEPLLSRTVATVAARPFCMRCMALNSLPISLLPRRSTRDDRSFSAIRSKCTTASSSGLTMDLTMAIRTSTMVKSATMITAISM